MGLSIQSRTCIQEDSAGEGWGEKEREREGGGGGGGKRERERERERDRQTDKTDASSQRDRGKQIDRHKQIKISEQMSRRQMPTEWSRQTEADKGRVGAGVRGPHFDSTSVAVVRCSFLQGHVQLL